MGSKQYGVYEHSVAFLVLCNRPHPSNGKFLWCMRSTLQTTQWADGWGPGSQLVLLHKAIQIGKGPLHYIVGHIKVSQQGVHLQQCHGMYWGMYIHTSSALAEAKTHPEQCFVL